MSGDPRSRRLGVLGAVGLILVAALGTRMWFLQSVRAEEFQARIDGSRLRTVLIPPERGRIFDDDGRILADNKQMLTVTVDWSVIRGRNTRRALFERLQGPLGMTVAEMEDRYGGRIVNTETGARAGTRYSSILPLPLKEDVSEETVQYLLQRNEDFPGVGVTTEWKRVYPYAPLASHVIGYLGAISAETLDSYLERGYNRNERVGQFGIERSMETELHGTWGKQVWEVDAAGTRTRLIEATEPVAGQDVQLTIDLDVQQYAEQALETQLKIRQNLPEEQQYYNSIDPNSRTVPRQRLYPDQPLYVPYKAPAGSVVVLDHSTGSVVAMASYPTFDNRWFNSGISSEKFGELFPVPKEGEKADPDRSILVNRAVSGNYNLGSTIKPFIAWSALQSGQLTIDEVFRDEGVWKLESVDDETCQVVRCVFKNATNVFGVPSKYGNVTVQDALAVSSDAFFYRLGEKMYRADDELLREMLLQFGFGSRTGIELPFEWGGRVPNDAIKAKLVEDGVLLKTESKQLTVGDNVQVAIGQGLLGSTPLQLANAYATIANDGYLLQPHVIKNMFAPLTPNGGPAWADLDAATTTYSPNAPTLVLELPVDEAQRGEIIAGLTRVIKGKGVWYPANAYHATTAEFLYRTYRGMPIAGKTGTAQGAGNYPWNDSSAFAAFSLDGESPYTVAAYLEKSGYGAHAAAPVVKCVFMALSGTTPMDDVVPAPPLDVNSTEVAPARELTNQGCLLGNLVGTARD